MKHELSKERLAHIANFHRTMTLPPSHDEIEAMARALLAAHEQEPVAELENLEHFISFWKKVQEGKATPRKNEIEHTVWFLEGLASISHPAPSIPAAVPDEQSAFEKFMEDNFRESIDRRHVKNGDGGYFAWDMVVAWVVWKGRAAMLQSAPDGWIPVSERFPEPNTYVLVSNGVWVGQGSYNDSDHLEDEEHWQDEHHEFINLLHHPVTHWQPLPAAPKGV